MDASQFQKMSYEKRRERWLTQQCSFFASLEEEAEQTLTFYDFPASWHRYIRTTNAIESLFSTIRRRTDQVQVFRHEQSCELLVWSVLTAVEFQRVPV